MAREKGDSRQDGRGATNDPVGIYLSQLSTCVRLSADEELALARQYRDSLEALKRIPHHKHSRVARDAARRADEAKRRLVEAHLPLVVHAARHLHFYARNAQQKVAFGDLICAGNMGLLEALLRFDPDKGNRFSTYALWWIRNKMSEEVRQARWPVRIPDHAYKNVIRLERKASEFVNKRGRDPTVSELAEATGQSVEWVNTIMLWARGDVISLDKRVGEDGSATLADLIADGNGTLPEDETRRDDVAEEASMKELQGAVRELLSTLQWREQAIIKHRFGLQRSSWGSLDSGGQALTRAEVGEAFNVTAERVRQIEVTALAKLRKRAAMPQPEQLPSGTLQS